MPDTMPPTSQLPAADDYNYARFDGSPAQGDFDAFPGHLHAGQPAPDATLTELDGAAVTLSDLWRSSNLLLEFGSYT